MMVAVSISGSIALYFFVAHFAAVWRGEA